MLISSNNVDELKIKTAQEKDINVILACIKGLAQHVGQLDQVSATQESLKDAIFNENSNIETRIAMLNNTPIGFMLFYKTFSTFKATPGLYIEDLFVFPQYRNKGFGKQMIDYVIDFAKAKNYNKVEWYVNNKNTKAINFYEKMNAKKLDYKSIFYVQL